VPGSDSHTSLYLLYAHMVAHQPLEIGQSVGCGDSLGQVGTTGASVNPHLHFEVRLGPANASFTDLAHYSTTASQAEMSGYCEWRVSGYFRMTDPMQFFAAVEKQP
jgi:murein DD-endopeptidase MepM/ murein hydrolase activator NlpD